MEINEIKIEEIRFSMVFESPIAKFYEALKWNDADKKKTSGFKKTLKLLKQLLNLHEFFQNK